MFEIAQNAPCGECFESIPQAKDEVLHWPMKEGYGKAGKQKTLSNFPTATTTTNYNYLWGTDSEGKVKAVGRMQRAMTFASCSRKI